MARKVINRRTRIPRRKKVSRRTKLSLKQKQPNSDIDDLSKYLQYGLSFDEEYQIPTWDISSTNLYRIRTNVSKPRDCVINALETLGLIDNRTADFMRIMVGNIGLTGEQVEDILNYEYKGHNFVFYETSIEYLSMFSANYLRPNSVMFCGIEYEDGGKHAFVIGKDINGLIRYIDAQSQAHGCFLDQCYKDVLQGRKFFTLRAKRSSTGDNSINPNYAPMED